METPRPRAGQDFAKAADAMEAWRQQQLAALHQAQRELFDRAREKAKEREKAKSKELEKRRQTDIQERARQKLLTAPRLELILRGSRTTMSALLADRMIKEHFKQDTRPDSTVLASLVRQAAKAATVEVERKHAQELSYTQSREQASLDEQLRSFKHARQTQPKHRDEFARSAIEGKAKVDFQQAAKDDAVERAVAKTREKQEQQRERDEQERGRNLGER
jgi:hypothetical protein